MTRDTVFHKRLLGVLAGLLLISTVGCAQPLTTREAGTLLGGALGAGSGALIGGGKGAAIGGALGALGGGLTGDQLQKQETLQAQQQRQIEAQQRELERQRQELERLKRQHES